MIKKKEYYQKHKEDIIDKRKDYRNTHKEEIKINKSEIIICECGLEITRDYKSKHKKTKVHDTLMKNKSDDKKQ